MGALMSASRLDPWPCTNEVQQTNQADKFSEEKLLDRHSNVEV